MNKHTKGPWFSEYTSPWSRHNSTKFRIETEDGNLICSTGNIKKSDHGFYEQEANARLIAAAPELLEALESSLKLLEAIERETGYVTAVTQKSFKYLIAKARGEA